MMSSTISPAESSQGQPSLVRNVVYSLSSGVAQRILSGILHFFLARTLGPRGYGVVSLASAASALAGVFVNWGTDITGMRAVARAPRDAAGLWAAYTRHRVLIWAAALLSIVAYSAIFVPAGPGRAATQIAGLQLGLLAASPAFALVGLERVLLVNALASTGVLLQLGLTVLLVHREADAVRAVVLGGIPAAALVVGGAAFLWRGGGRVGTRIRLPLAGFLREGSQPLVTWMCSGATLNLDLAIVAAADPLQGGLYAVGWKLRSVLFGGNSLLQTALLPRIAGATGDRRQLKAILLFVEAFAGFLLAGVVVAVAPAIARVLGSGYAGADRVIALLGIHTGVMYLFQSSVNPLMVEHREELAVRFYLLEAALSFVAVLIGVRLQGATGAACGVLAAEIVTVCAVLCFGDAAGALHPFRLAGMGLVAVVIGCAVQKAGPLALEPLAACIVKSAAVCLLFPLALFLIDKEHTKSICLMLVHGHSR